MAKAKLQTHHTPKGVAVYPWLTTPDTKFNADGEYRIKLKLSKKDAAPIIKMIDEAIEKKMPEAIKELNENPKALAAYEKSGKAIFEGREVKKGKVIKPGKLVGIVESRPYAAVLDDQGEETNDVEFTFKMKALVKPKDKDPFTQKPKLFDARGKRMEGRPPAIHGGSVVKVGYQIVPFSTSIAGCGVSLRLQAVMVVKLVSSGGTAEDYGFEAEDDGYEFTPSEDDAPATEKPAAKAEDSGSEDESADF